ncbi:hypothetical protein [Saccharothrix hoggarensis]|uniref:Uncharacterized protein n=1 Tax=Saccharothrix hoggarensis TaxID=913853 RepID=A0ABW3QPZ5_9PSEU
MTQPPPEQPPGRPLPGQPFPGQPSPGQPFPGQPSSGQPFPGQAFGAPPFDPYGQPVQPVHYPPAQPRYPQAGPHHQSAQPAYPGQMRSVDHLTTAVARPRVVMVAFTFWVLAALSWPLGTVLRSIAEGGFVPWFGTVMTLFFTGCVAIAGVWAAVLFLNGSYHARVGLCGVSMVIGVLALATAIVAARDGDTEVLSWVVIVARLVLPAVAAVFSFLPGTRHYFAGNVG